ncbi:hypothetical protein JCM8097_006402 [Rhodosporidiobolus ruineniae]
MATPRPHTAYDACDEGGQHQYTLPDKGSSTFWKCLCCPCWAIFTCAASEGAAAVSPVGMLGGSGDKSDEPTCVKCGLNQSESAAIAAAKEAEANGMRTSKGPGYFTAQTMSINQSAYPPSPLPFSSAQPSPSPTPNRKPFPVPSPIPGSPAPPYYSAPPKEVEMREGQPNPVQMWVNAQQTQGAVPGEGRY